MLALIFALLTLTVDDANAAVGQLLGSDSTACDRRWRRPYDCPTSITEALDAVSDRELPIEARSSSRWYGRHNGDSGHDPRLHAKGLRRGVLDPRCPWHRSPDGMSTVGPHGLMYVYNVGRLGVPANCIPWQSFGFSIVSAFAAGSLYLDQCREKRSGWSWCPRRGAIVSARKRRASKQRNLSVARASAAS